MDEDEPACGTLPTVVLDGANVLESFAKRPGFLGPQHYAAALDAIVGQFAAQGFRTIVVLPSSWQDRRMPAATPGILWAPARERGDDDLFALSLTFDLDGYLVSNDYFRDHITSYSDQFGHAEGEKLASFVRARVVTYAWAGETLLPHPMTMRAAFLDKKVRPPGPVLAYTPVAAPAPVQSTQIAAFNLPGSAPLSVERVPMPATVPVAPLFPSAAETRASLRREVETAVQAALTMGNGTCTDLTRSVPTKGAEGVAGVDIDWAAVAAGEPVDSPVTHFHLALEPPHGSRVIDHSSVTERIMRVVDMEAEFWGEREAAARSQGRSSSTGRDGSSGADGRARYGGYHTQTPLDKQARAALGFQYPAFTLWSPTRRALLLEGVQYLRKRGPLPGSGLERGRKGGMDDL